MNNRACLIALNQIPGVGPRTIQKLFSRWPVLTDCLSLSSAQLKQEGLSPALIQAIQNIDLHAVEASFAFEQLPHHHLLTLDDEAYPTLLKEIDDPPPVLYAVGDLSCLNAPLLAMIGSRNPSPTGKENAYQWARSLAAHSITVVSGLALGIDAAAHLGCLKAQGKTIAVLGTGIDVIYPSQHRALAEQITQHGLLISEFPLKTLPKAGHFPRRNRIISGLSMATLVVEATLKSGSLITARLALEQNRGVLTMPGSIHLPQAQGCHYLLKQGARLVTCYQEVLEEIGMTAVSLVENKTSIKNKIALNAVEKAVLEAVGFEMTSVDQIIQQTGLTPNLALSTLTTLELNSMISQFLGGYIKLT